MSLSPLLLAWTLMVGASIGSFLNVVIYRLPRGFHVNIPSRSACRSCKRRLRASENIPILSYLWLRGRCSGCASTISPRYPLVEALTMFLFAGVYLHYGLRFDTLYYWVFCSALVAITFIDLDFRIIPDRISFPMIALGLACSPLVQTLGLAGSALGIATGGFTFWSLAYAYEKITGREGLGFGDVKLLAMIGAFLGIKGVASTVLLSSIIGSVMGLSLMLIQKKNLKLALPYGPFLAIGAIAHLFWGDYIALTFYPQFYE